jgi:dipeptidyl-peptidase-4
MYNLARSLASALCVSMIATIAAAEQSRNYPPINAQYLRDHAETRGFMLGRPTKARPTPDGKAVLFLRSQPRRAKLELYEFDIATAKTRLLLTPEQLLAGGEENLSPEEKARRERMRVSVGGFTDYQVSDDGRLVLVSLSGKLYVLDRATGKTTQLKTGDGTILDPKFSPDSESIAYVRDYDVYVLELATQQERRVTTGGTELITHGLAEFVAQEEMSRFSGFWWAPDSKHIVFEEADATGVEVWHVADPARPDQSPHSSFYPRPGKANVRVRLGVAPIAGGDPVWIKWDADRFPYLATVRWATEVPQPLLLAAVQSRDQTEMAVLLAHWETGETRLILTERDPVWVNIDQDMPRAFGRDALGVLWTSESSGGPELQLRVWTGEDGFSDIMSRLVPQSAGYQGLVNVGRGDEKADWIVYRASVDPTESHLFGGNWDEADLREARPWLLPMRRRQVTTEPGVYDATFAKNHSIYTQLAQRPGAMPQTTVHRADGSLIAELPSVAEEPPFVPRAEFVKVGDGDGFHAVVVRPQNFEKGRKYPVIVDVYGGPGHNKVVKNMSRLLIDQWMADQGFIVVSIDGRGTPGRGRDWERAIAKRFGSVPLADQVAGLKALGEKFPELDLDRVGIVGWSFGGYMAALAVLREPDVFKAAVAGAPVVDWLDYDTHYTERYLGLPQDHPEAYREGSLLTYAADLRRPLLLVHGTADDNVYFRHSLKLADALFRAGKDFEMLPLSGLTHMVPEPVVMQSLWSRVVRHFQKHL